jgi:oligopeptide transport system substrate-binding protein
MRLPTDPPTIDWTLATDNISKEVIAQIHEGLVQEDVDSKPVPALAESWKVSADGKTYTFTLREGLKWSDGQPLVAQHFIDSWERLLNPKTAAEYAYFLFDLVGAEDYQKGALTDFAKVGVKAENDRTLVVTLRSPVAYWIHVPTFWVTYPLRKDIVAKYGDKWTDGDKIVTAGAYNMTGWERDSRVSLVKNPHYFDAAKHPNMPAKAEFRIIKEDTTAVTVFQSGGLEIVRDLPPAQLSALVNMPEFVSSPYFRGYYVGFNIKNPDVADVRIRQALAHAIDREEIAKLLPKMVTPTSSWIPAGLNGANEARGLKFDAEKAKKLWASIPKKPAKLDLWYDQKEKNKLIMENVQNQWKRTLGIDVTLQTQEWKVYLKTIRTQKPAAWRLGWGADYPDADTFMNLFTCASGNNQTGLCSSAYDTLIKKAASSSDEKARAEAYDQAQKILLEDEAAIVPLFNETNLHLVSRRVEGFRVSPMNDFYFKNLRLK